MNEDLLRELFDHYNLGSTEQEFNEFKNGMSDPKNARAFFDSYELGNDDDFKEFVSYLGIGTSNQDFLDVNSIQITPQQDALLRTIQDVEAKQNQGWVGFGGEKIPKNLKDHPRKVFGKTKYGTTTAAGPYQFTATTWDFTQDLVEKKTGKRLGAFGQKENDIAALVLAEYEYERRSGGGNIYEDLSTDPEKVREVLAGKGANTVWQGLQNDRTFSDRYNQYLNIQSPGFYEKPFMLKNVPQKSDTNEFAERDAKYNKGPAPTISTEGIYDPGMESMGDGKEESLDEKTKRLAGASVELTDAKKRLQNSKYSDVKNIQQDVEQNKAVIKNDYINGFVDWTTGEIMPEISESVKSRQISPRQEYDYRGAVSNYSLIVKNSSELLKDRYGDSFVEEYSTAMNSLQKTSDQIKKLEKTIKAKKGTVPEVEETKPLMESIDTTKSQINEIVAKAKEVSLYQDSLLKQSETLKELYNNGDLSYEDYVERYNTVKDAFDKADVERESLKEQESKLLEVHNSSVEELNKKSQDYALSFDSDETLKTYYNLIDKFNSEKKIVEKYDNDPIFLDFKNSYVALDELNKQRKFLDPVGYSEDVRNALTQRKADIMARVNVPGENQIVNIGKPYLNKLGQWGIELGSQVLGLAQLAAEVVPSIPGTEGISAQDRENAILSLESAKNYLQMGKNRMDAFIPSNLKGEFMFNYVDPDGIKNILPKNIDKIQVKNGEVIDFRDKDNFIITPDLTEEQEKIIADYVKQKEDDVKTDYGVQRLFVNNVETAADVVAMLYGGAGAAKLIGRTFKTLSPMAASTTGVGLMSFAQQLNSNITNYLGQGLSTDDAIKSGVLVSGATAAVESLVGPLESKIVARLNGKLPFKYIEDKKIIIADLAAGKIGAKNATDALTYSLINAAKEVGLENFEEILGNEVADYIDSAILGTRREEMDMLDFKNQFAAVTLISLPTAGFSVGRDITQRIGDIRSSVLYNSIKNREAFNKTVDDFLSEFDEDILLTDEQKKLKTNALFYRNILIPYIESGLSMYPNLTDAQGAALTGLFSHRFNAQQQIAKEKKKEVPNDIVIKKSEETLKNIENEIEEIVKGNKKVEENSFLKDETFTNVEDKNGNGKIVYKFGAVPEVEYKVGDKVNFGSLGEITITAIGQDKDGNFTIDYSKEDTVTEQVSTKTFLGRDITDGKKIFTDFDNTLYDPKTGQLTAVGKELREKLDSGELTPDDVEILTARDAEQAGDIAKLFPELTIKSGLSPEAKAAEVAKAEGNSIFIDDNKENLSAAAGKGEVIDSATVVPQTPREVVQEDIQTNEGVNEGVTTTKPEPNKVNVLGQEINFYDNYIPETEEDVEDNAVYTFSSPTKEGLPEKLRDTAKKSIEGEVNGKKVERWSASISGSELKTIISETPKTKKDTTQEAKTTDTTQSTTEPINVQQGSPDTATEPILTTTLPGSSAEGTYVKDGEKWFVAKKDGTPSKREVKKPEFINHLNTTQGQSLPQKTNDGANWRKKYKEANAFEKSDILRNIASVGSEQELSDILDMLVKGSPGESNIAWEVAYRTNSKETFERAVANRALRKSTDDENINSLREKKFGKPSTAAQKETSTTTTEIKDVILNNSTNTGKLPKRTYTKVGNNWQYMEGGKPKTVRSKNVTEQLDKLATPKTKTGEVAPAKKATPAQELTTPEDVDKKIKDIVKKMQGLKGKKPKGARASLFGLDLIATEIGLPLWNRAVDFAIGQVEKGTSFGKAVAATVDFIDSRIKGKKWDKEGFKKGFESYLADNTSKQVDTILEPIGKDAKEREEQIYKFFALPSTGGDKVKARELAKITNKLWENVAFELGKRNMQAANDWVQSRVAMMGKTSVEGARAMGGVFQNEINSGQAAFDKWKGANTLVAKSEVQDIKTGQPVVIRGYHGTTNEFYEFDSSVKGNIEGHLGKVNYFTTDKLDAAQNYQSDGADITNRIEQVAERIADQLYDDYADYNNDNAIDYKQVSEDFNIPLEEIIDIEDFLEIGRLIGKRRLQGGTEKVLDVFIKLNNPVVLGNGNSYVDLTDRTQFEDYLEDAAEEIADENDITLEEAKQDYSWDIDIRAMELADYQNPLQKALEKAISDNTYDYEKSYEKASEILSDFYESEVNLKQLEDRLRKELSYEQNEEGDLTSSQIIADFFKNLGFDGIVLTDVSKRFMNMGLSNSTSHIHVFDEYNNQIKLADGTNKTFNPNTSDIRFQSQQPITTVEAATNVANNLITELDRMIKERSDKNAIKEKGLTLAQAAQQVKDLKAVKAELQSNMKDPRWQVDAYHGTPYVFDKFTTDKIGTGEGAQAFGWGLYFTDLEDIARNYAKNLSKETFLFNGEEIKDKDVNFYLRGGLSASGVVTSKTIQYALDEARADYKENPYTNIKNAINILENLKDGELSIKPNRNLYKVSLHKGKTPDQYTWLEWDKSTPDSIINKIKKVLPELSVVNKNDYDIEESFGYGDTFRGYVITSNRGGNLGGLFRTKEEAEAYLDKSVNSGQSIYESISEELGSDKAASLFLLENGIDGIKYPAESISRGATSDTARGFNYVVFDENAVIIEERIQFQQEAAQFRAAAIEVAKNQVIIAALDAPNASSFVHEMAHSFEPDLTVDERQTFIDEYNQKFGDKVKGWNTDVSEYFARLWEKYLSNGRQLSEADVKDEAKRGVIQEIFDKFTEYLKGIYNGVIEYTNTKGVKREINISPEVQTVFDRVMGIDTQQETTKPTTKTEALANLKQAAKNFASAWITGDDKLGIYFDPKEAAINRSKTAMELFDALVDLIKVNLSGSKFSKQDLVKLVKDNYDIDIDLKGASYLFDEVNNPGNNREQVKTVGELRQAIDDLREEFEAEKEDINTFREKVSNLIDSMRDKAAETGKNYFFSMAELKDIANRASKVFDEESLQKFSDFIENKLERKDVQQIKSKIKGIRGIANALKGYYLKVGKSPILKDQLKNAAKFNFNDRRTHKNSPFVLNATNKKGKNTKAAMEEAMRKIHIDDVERFYEFMTNLKKGVSTVDFFEEAKYFASLYKQQLAEKTERNSIKNAQFDENGNLIEGGVVITEYKDLPKKYKDEFQKRGMLFDEDGNAIDSDGNIVKENKDLTSLEQDALNRFNKNKRAEEKKIEKINKDEELRAEIIDEINDIKSRNREKISDPAFQKLIDSFLSLTDADIANATTDELNKLLNGYNSIVNTNNPGKDFENVLSEVTARRKAEDLVNLMKTRSGKFRILLRDLIRGAVSSKTKVQQYENIIKKKPLRRLDSIFKGRDGSEFFEKTVNQIASGFGVFTAFNNKIKKELRDNTKGIKARDQIRLKLYAIDRQHKNNPESKEIKSLEQEMQDAELYASNDTNYQLGTYAIAKEIYEQEKAANGGVFDYEKMELSDAEKKLLDYIDNKFVDNQGKVLVSGSRTNKDTKTYFFYTPLDRMKDLDKVSQVSNFAEATLEGKNIPINNMTAGNVNARTKTKLPIRDWNIVTSSYESMKETELDYQMRQPLKDFGLLMKNAILSFNNEISSLREQIKNETNEDTIKKLKEDLETAINNRDFLDATANVVKDVSKEQFMQQFDVLTASDRVSEFLAEIGYGAVLASVPRAGAEFLSNLGFAFFYFKDFTTGLKYAANPKNLGKIYEFVTRNPSTQQTRLLAHTGSLRADRVETPGLGKNVQYTSKIKNAALDAVDSYKSIMSSINDGLNSVGDRAVALPLWMGSFDRAFNKARRQEIEESLNINDFDSREDYEKEVKRLLKEQKFDLDKFLNDPDYEFENRDTIDKALKKADDNLSQGFSSFNPFEGIADLKSGAKKGFLDNFNSFLQRFIRFEYQSAEDAVNALMGRGSMSRSQGLALLTATLTRMTAYTLISKILKDLWEEYVTTPLFDAILSPLEAGATRTEKDIEREVEDGKTSELTYDLRTALLGSVAQLVTGRHLGALWKIPINAGIEAFNIVKGEDLGLRSGPTYEAWKNSLVWSTFKFPKLESLEEGSEAAEELKVKENKYSSMSFGGKDIISKKIDAYKYLLQFGFAFTGQYSPLANAALDVSVDIFRKAKLDRETQWLRDLDPIQQKAISEMLWKYSVGSLATAIIPLPAPRDIKAVLKNTRAALDFGPDVDDKIYKKAKSPNATKADINAGLDRMKEIRSEQYRDFDEEFDEYLINEVPGILEKYKKEGGSKPRRVSHNNKFYYYKDGEWTYENGDKMSTVRKDETKELLNSLRDRHAYTEAWERIMIDMYKKTLLTHIQPEIISVGEFRLVPKGDGTKLEIEQGKEPRFRFGENKRVFRVPLR